MRHSNQINILKMNMQLVFSIYQQTPKVLMIKVRGDEGEMPSPFLANRLLVCIIYDAITVMTSQVSIAIFYF